MGKITKRGATALPGLVAERIDPDILTKLTRNNFEGGVVLVTGTNGKTTTSRYITHILNDSGKQPLQNSAGSNMTRGILSTIIKASDLRGRVEQSQAIFEVDEAYIPVVIKATQPKIVVITNLFRDQLDRYGELDNIAKSFSRALEDVESATLVLNADDPLVAGLGHKYAGVSKYFGVNHYSGESIEHDHTADSIFDESTGEELTYKQRYFGHIGIYSAKTKALSRPAPIVAVTKTTSLTRQHSNIVVKIATKSYDMRLNTPGLYTIYNAIAALTVAQVLQLDIHSAIKTITSSGTAFGRTEKLSYKNNAIYMLLIKNPTGFNQIIQTFLKPKPQNTPVLFAINDKIADGRDVSWLWDAALEDLSGYKGMIVCTGTRAYDMALRLKYAGIKSVYIEQDSKKALDYLLSHTKSKQYYLVPTYTAMLGLYAHIAQTTDIDSFTTKQEQQT